jgi:hypothetical protein
VDLLLSEGTFTQDTAHAVSGGGDRNGSDVAGGVEERDGRGLVIPDLGISVAPTDDDRGERGLLQAEAKIPAVAGFGGAVTAEVGGDLVVSESYLGADDAAITRDLAVFTGVLVHSLPPPHSMWRSTPITFP